MNLSERRVTVNDEHMVRFRCWLVASLLVAASAGCARAPAPAGPLPASTSTPRASSAPAEPTSTASASVTAVTSSARPSSSRSASSSPPPIPPLSAKARAAGLIDVRTIIADAIIDLRYATTNNFVGVTLYPADARCLVHESMAPGLVTAAKRLRLEGDVLVFWDCYRPHSVQVHMFEVVPDPNWVARPGPFATSHEAGRSVDVTLAHASTGLSCPPAQRVQRHCLLDLGTDFDDFTSHAHAFATSGVGPRAQANRARLRTAMNAGGIVVYSGEWWHFDGPGSLVDRPHLGAPLS